MLPDLDQTLAEDVLVCGDVKTQKRITGLPPAPPTRSGHAPKGSAHATAAGGVVPTAAAPKR